MVGVLDIMVYVFSAVFAALVNAYNKSRLMLIYIHLDGSCGYFTDFTKKR